MATNEAPAGAGVTPAPAVAVVQTTGTTVSAVQEAAKEGLVTTTIMPVPAETSGIPTPSATVVTSSKSDSTVASISAGPSTSSPGPAPAKTAATPAAKATPAAAGPAKAAATKTAAAKPDPATTKAGPASKTAPKAAPPGYKLIKVKNADGKIIVVKKKLTAEEIAAAENKGKSAKADRTASDQVKSVEYKIVSVPQPDGTLVKVRRAVHAEDAPVEKPAAIAASKAAASKDSATKDAVVSAPEAAPISEAMRQKMIREQKNKFRKGRSRKFRRGLFHGFARQLIGDLPDIELDTDGFKDGDQVISDDDSDLDWDSDNDRSRHGARDNNDRHSIADGAEHGSRDANSSGNNHGSSDPLDIKTKAVASHAYDAANAAHQQNKKPTPAPAAAPAVDGIATAKPANGANGANEKITFNVTNNDFEKLDEEAQFSQLQRHWESFSFYFMASLAVVLPLLFVLLAIGATLMDGKQTTSHWSAVASALKVAVSAWPIVFAAVVAQCFKTFATYKVERGIKLMQLEQLVGSNSFASAIKQPIVLRRLDVYTLVIFVAWCLSPLGSQAIERVQTPAWKEHCQDSTVWYLSRNGVNPVLDKFEDLYKDGNDEGTHMQQITMAFATLFEPNAGPGGESASYFQDSWGNVKTMTLDTFESSVFGVPFFTNQSMFASHFERYEKPWADESPSAQISRNESFTFSLESSYFEFDCGEWSTLSSSEMADNVEIYDLQPSLANYPTYYMAFGWADNIFSSTTSPNILRWGSFNWKTGNHSAPVSSQIEVNKTSVLLPPLRNSSVNYSYIECPIRQVFVAYKVSCSMSELSYMNMGSYTCMYDNGIEELSQDSGTSFFDFTYQFVSAVTPTQYTADNTITPFERFIASGGKKYDTLFDDTDMSFDPEINSTYAYWYDLSNNTAPQGFGITFGYAFNSWMDAGYCPGKCRTAYPTELVDLSGGVNTYGADKNYNPVNDLNSSLQIPTEMFKSTDATWCYTQDHVFEVHHQYLALLYTCSIILLIIGFISVFIESRIVAPDVLGYASTLARSSRYLHLPKTTAGMSAPDRLRKLGGTVVMMQDVKKDADIGKIALGNKTQDSRRLTTDRTYR